MGIKELNEVQTEKRLDKHRDQVYGGIMNEVKTIILEWFGDLDPAEEYIPPATLREWKDLPNEEYCGGEETYGELLNGVCMDHMQGVFTEDEQPDENTMWSWIHEACHSAEPGVTFNKHLAKYYEEQYAEWLVALQDAQRALKKLKRGYRDINADWQPSW